MNSIICRYFDIAMLYFKVRTGRDAFLAYGTCLVQDLEFCIDAIEVWRK